MDDRGEVGEEASQSPLAFSADSAAAISAAAAAAAAALPAACSALPVATAAAVLVESLFASAPSGYDCDKQLALYNDSQTFGEIATADVELFVQRVGGAAASRELSFADLGSGLGKLALAAAFFFKRSLGVENAPERAAVAQAALDALSALAPEPASRASVVCGDMLTTPLADVDVVFSHNLVYSRALSRALEARLDCELREGARVYTVAELRFSARCKLQATLEATYNWAPEGELRPLYEYAVEGAPSSPAAEDDR